MQNTPAPQPNGIKTIKYPYCDQSGFHQGEQLNQICLEKDCKSCPLICSACSHEKHRTHNQKPIKLFLHENFQKLSGLKQNYKGCNSNDQNILIQTIDEIKNEMVKDFQTQMNEIKKLGEKIESLFSSYFENLKSAIIKQNNIFQEIDNIQQKIYSTDLTKSSLQSHITYLIEQQKFVQNMEEVITSQQELESSESTQNSTNSDKTQPENHSITQNIMENIKDQVTSIKTIVNDHTKDINKNFTEIEKLIEDQSQSSLQNLMNFQVQFSYDACMHEQLKKKDKTTVISKNATGYKMAVMDPALKLKRQQFAFKINHIGPSNWIGIGLCVKSKVIEKKFGFQSSMIGHGAYMISSNGGSWSNHQKEFNQCVKSFIFKKNDVIICDFQPDNKKVIFKNQKSNQNYSLSLDLSTQQELHPGVILYSMDDEVEFLNQVPKK